jgi:hypothetical protein
MHEQINSDAGALHTCKHEGSCTALKTLALVLPIRRFHMTAAKHYYGVRIYFGALTLRNAHSVDLGTAWWLLGKRLQQLAQLW